MALTATGAASAGVNCVTAGNEIVPAGTFSYTLTLSITGAGSITSVSYSGGAPAGVSVTGSGLVWAVSIAPGQSVFPDESFEFVQYDEDFNPSFYEVGTAAAAPENSTVFVYNPPIPFERPFNFSFFVNYTTAEIPGDPPTPGSPASESVLVLQNFVWDPDIGLGQLQVAIDNSRY